jgi:flagellar biosynthetic protein FlhB
MADQGQRTEQPTQRRLDKARREGNFAVSREFVSGLQFLAAVSLLTAWGGGWFAAGRQGLRRLVGQAFSADPLDLGRAIGLGRGILAGLLVSVTAAGGLMVAISLAAQLASTRLGVSLAKLKPELRRLSPLVRLKDLPRHNLPTFLQALVLVPLIALTLQAVVRDNLGLYLRLPLVGLEPAVQQVGESIASLLWKAAGLFLVLGAFDFWRSRRRYIKDLRMSKQEVREEFKEIEGSPLVKMRIRRLQRDLLRRRMMSQVPKATAVVVNPTHYAVALRFQPERMAAPVVVAKGKNYLARRIRQLAVEHEIPVVENPPLAQALYVAVEVGQEIPAHLYRAVAEILAYIYRLLGGRLPG